MKMWPTLQMVIIVRKVYNENPIEVAKAFEDHGFKFLP